MIRTIVTSCVLLLCLLEFSSQATAEDPVKSPEASAPKGPLTPEESLKHLVLADKNLQIEIVAAEPEVIDPVAIQFDEHGRLWVVELSDYPNGPEPGKPPMSRIKLLEDKDGDGRFETAHIFADKLLFATGVQPWDGGVIVTLAGEVAYFKDTDGDHRADVRETWFTGFAQANPQLRANHPTFGPDGWIYVANGLRGGNVIAVKKDWPSRLGIPARPSGKSNSEESGKNAQPTEPQPVSLTGRDFKFDPLTGRYEAISGNGQFGMTFDAWGNRFVCDNRHPCRHVIFEEDFIKRCPHVAFPAVVHDVIPDNDKNRVFPLTSAWTTSNLHAGTFTAACGVTVYTGDWLPEEFRGNVFVCEPTGNLVQRAVLEPDGVTFKSHNPYARRTGGVSPLVDQNESNANGANATRGLTPPVRQDTQEFLASRDDWFRPVDLQNGPDGALYVVDMYRAVIEHPEWVPDELKKRPDTWLGNDMGRIYRIRPKSVGRSKAIANNDPLAKLNSPNGWDRQTALRQFRTKNQKPIEFSVSDVKRPEGLCLGMRAGLIGRAEMIGLLDNENPRVREEAVLGTGIALWQGTDEEFIRAERWKYVCPNFGDDSRIVLRALQSLASTEIPETRRTNLLAMAALCCCSDTNLRTTLLGASSDSELALLTRLFSDDHNYKETLRRRTEEWVLLSQALASSVATYGRANDLTALLQLITHHASEERFEDSAPLVVGLASALLRRGKRLEELVATLPADQRSQFTLLFNAAVEIAWSDRITVAKNADVLRQRRPLAMRLLQFAPFGYAEPALKRLAKSRSDQSERLNAIETLATFHYPEVTDWLIDRYDVETPAIRRAILAALFASKERQLRLLESIEQGQIAATELDPVRVNQLTQAKDETLRERAKTVLAAAAPASRHEVLDAYRPALALTADPKRGREVFVKNCSTCHRVDNVGVNVAPDISDTRTKKPEQLLLDILDPNKAIDANYFAYAVVTKEGKTESGVISSETATSITLKQPEGKVLTLLRTDIDELRNTGLSLMPVGVEKNIDQQAMADLIFWLKNWRYLDGKVPATSLGGK